MRSSVGTGSEQPRSRDEFAGVAIADSENRFSGALSAMRAGIHGASIAAESWSPRAPSAAVFTETLGDQVGAEGVGDVGAHEGAGRGAALGVEVHDAVDLGRLAEACGR